MFGAFEKFMTEIDNVTCETTVVYDLFEECTAEEIAELFKEVR